MKTPPQLDEDQRLVLREVIDQGVIRGRELLRATRMDPAKLSEAVQELRNKDLIQVRGDVGNPSEIPYAVISVRPSDTKFLKYSVS